MSDDELVVAELDDGLSIVSVIQVDQATHVYELRRDGAVLGTFATLRDVVQAAKRPGSIASTPPLDPMDAQLRQGPSLWGTLGNYPTLDR